MDHKITPHLCNSGLKLDFNFLKAVPTDYDFVADDERMGEEKDFNNVELRKQLNMYTIPLLFRFIKSIVNKSTLNILENMDDDTVRVKLQCFEKIK